MSSLQEILKNLDANAPMKLSEIIELEISEYKQSEAYQVLIDSKKYYANKNSAIEERIRKIPDGKGRMMATKMLSNIKVPHGFYRKVADQKTGYLLSKPFSVTTEGDTDTSEYEDYLDELFDFRFKMQLKQVGIEAQAGSGWMHPQIKDSRLRFKRIPAENAIPIWADDERRELDAFIYFYSVTAYRVSTKRKIDRVEYWDRSGVRYFERDPDKTGSVLVEIIPESGQPQAHIEVMTSPEGMASGAPEISESMNWDRVPFVPFRVNSWEIPLLNSIKPQIDEFDAKVSDIANSVADFPILKIKDYGGEASADIWDYMLTQWALHVRDGGDVDFMKLDVDVANLLEFCKFLREQIFEFGRAVDTQSERFNAAMSGAAIQKLYADLDLDANDMEAEFQASMEDLIWFADAFYSLTTRVDVSKVKVDILFNRDIMLNESEVIQDVIASSAILSEETTLANHPWVSNAKEEMERKEAEAEASSRAETGRQDSLMFPTLPNSLDTNTQTAEPIQGAPGNDQSGAAVNTDE